MKRFFAAAIVVLSISATVSAADRQLLGMMMPDAKLLSGMNVVQVRNSPFGQFLLMQGPFSQPEFQKFVAATGFDPLRDITEIVAATLGMPGDKSGLAAVRGTFNVAQIVSFVKLSGEKVDESQGVPMIVSPDGGIAIALVDHTLVLAGDPNSVIAALPRRSAPATLDPVLMAKANSLSVTDDVWAVSTMNPSAVGLAPAPKSGGFDFSALQSIQQSSAGLKFGTSLNVTAEIVTDTPQNADSLANVARMLVQLGTLNPPDAQLAGVLQNLSIKTAGTAIQLSVAIPEEMIEQMSPTRRAPQVRKVAERTK